MQNVLLFASLFLKASLLCGVGPGVILAVLVEKKPEYVKKIFLVYEAVARTGFVGIGTYLQSLRGDGERDEPSCRPPGVAETVLRTLSGACRNHGRRCAHADLESRERSRGGYSESSSRVLKGW